MYALRIYVDCWHLEWQVSSMAQTSNALSQIFGEVGHLALKPKVHSHSSEEHNNVDRTKWRKLLRQCNRSNIDKKGLHFAKPFSNVKTLLVNIGLTKDISWCLQLGDGKLAPELLPELQKLRDSGTTIP